MGRLGCHLPRFKVATDDDNQLTCRQGGGSRTLAF